MENYICCIILLSPLLLQGAIDSIYLWDNDGGKYKMRYPVVAAGPTFGYFAWEDGRYSTLDIFRGRWQWPNIFLPEEQIIEDSYDKRSEYQPHADAPFCSNYDVIYVWRYYHPDSIKSKIVARWEKNWTFGTPITIDSVVSNPFRWFAQPTVSCRDNGYFIVSYIVVDWVSINPVKLKKTIMYKRYDSSGGFIASATVESDAEDGSCRVAYCDSGFVIAYCDTSKNGDGTKKSIYVQARNATGGIIVSRLKVSRYNQTDTWDEVEPDIAINRWGSGAIVWKDLRYGENDPDIYGMTFQLRSNEFRIIDTSITIDFTTNKSRYPRVTMIHQDPSAIRNRYFLAVWEEDSANYSGSDTTDIKGRVFTTTLLNKFRVNVTVNKKDAWPDVSCRNSDSCLIIWAWRDWIPEAQDEENSLNMRYCYYYADNDTGVRFPQNYQFNPIPVCGASRAWYYDNENYDNPATPDWNEDPIDEPDSVYLDLDSAIVDQIDELNRNNQYRVFNCDTLPRQKSIYDYDHIIMDLGYRGEGKTAGIISASDKNNLVSYINSGKPVIVFGNDFGKMYNGDTLFKLFHANYLHDGYSDSTGNIDTLYGQSGTLFYGETLAYTYKENADNYVDEISPKTGAKLLLQSWAPGKWYAGRAVGWGNYWKDGPRVAGSTIYCSFSAAGIKDRRHPHTYAEFIRRCLGFLKLQCPPEPITTLTAATGSSEGRVTITWNVVSDDSLGESAEGSYKLKFSRTKMTSEDEFNSAETYYQTWNTKDSTVGVPVTYTLYGLPPMDTLIFALKVSDEAGLWGTLGAEPRAIVAGDSVTPHTITFGYNYVKDFSNKYEYINRRRKNDTGTDYDSLFVTWDYPYSQPWFEFGFARCNLNTEGDLFIYVDTKSGGADSTVPYNGSSGRSGFVSDFRPDYCLIVENATIRRYRKWVATKDGRGSWVYVDSGGTRVEEDNVVNNYLYTEGYIRFDTMAYTAGNPFKLVVLMTEEASNSIINAFPIFNPLGTYRNITQYYDWGNDGLTSGKVPARRQIIGIEEAPISKTEIRSQKFEVQPNPFREKALIILPELDVPPQDISLKIYDVSGRLVKQFNHSTIQPFNRVFWDGTDDNGRKVAQGIYFCELAIPERTETIKIIYLK